ncbi:UDP-2,4-diacetamido-2,4,6-trideoxy-beta-L-altropyranose hydrolase [Shewanella sedimentimangrovi]|uniref:UDP-2,4-diacetamido-2,4, 6-trideoxy-beta-L-altropyranose hydrolase n=1 Tax=Shewanella sedimentimangrovi TaxID=2814293 RepID=A0ABX7QZ82_9GAMM|nr:UDP-2,4-diacetamido-2,4,6-trideoxy-beta-L-altropyranose hydrolase [Shewanella sedimentimangrovi]QSX36118.1 UDP-2,4-diacetamido-2,4,6-trideoxy-beta-L-altropyranose hydrolase [Shewanella sedimentimangrovi]
MHVVIRADASRWIGSGHIMRCLVLADAIKAAGHDVTFVCRPQPGDLTGLIKERGHRLITLPVVRAPLIPRHSADYEAWLQVAWETDSAQLLVKVASADWILVDHYGLPAEWEQEVAKALRCRVLAIDDLARPHSCDILVDPTALRCHSAYYGLVPAHCLCLVGAKYALLAPGFKEWRKIIRKTHRDPRRVLVSMGGIDEPNATLRVLKVLKAVAEKLSVTVLLSQRAPHYHPVKSYCDSNKDWIQHIDFCDNMAELMAEHGVAIGAPGSTSWERACLSLPSIVIPLAENQGAICASLVKAKAAISIPIDAIENELLSALGHLQEHYEIYQDNNWILCDGDGCERVLGYLINE